MTEVWHYGGVTTRGRTLTQLPARGRLHALVSTTRHMHRGLTAGAAHQYIKRARKARSVVTEAVTRVLATRKHSIAALAAGRAVTKTATAAALVTLAVT